MNSKNNIRKKENKTNNFANYNLGNKQENVNNDLYKNIEKNNTIFFDHQQNEKGNL